MKKYKISINCLSVFDHFVGLALKGLRMIHNYYEKGYETLLEMRGQPTMKIKRIKQLKTEIFKTVNNLNLDFLKTYETLCAI